MENTDTILVMDKVQYFLHLPSHVKRLVMSFECSKLMGENMDIPAHVINGSITAIRGRINIPDINVVSLSPEINYPSLELI